MPSSDLAIEVTSWAMRLEQLRAQVASRNIATVSLPGATAQRVDFASRLSSIRAAVQVSDASVATVQDMLDLPIDVGAVASVPMGGGVALDAEVADLSEAELRYKALAEALSRELSMLTLAASGKQ